MRYKYLYRNLENEGKSSFEVRENEVIKQSARLRG